MLPDYNDDELHEIQKEIGLGLNDILMMYNRVMLMLIGFFSAINLYRDGKLWIGILVFIVCNLVANLYIHKKFHYNVYINILEKGDSIVLPLGENVIPFVSDLYMNTEDKKLFNKYIDEAIKSIDVPIQFEVMSIEYLKTTYYVNFKPEKSKSIFNYLNRGE
jgi:hypothetical protein